MSNSFKQRLVRSWTTVVMLYTSGRRDGWRHTLLHSFTCLFISLALSSLLFLSLYAVNVDLMVTELTTASFSLLLFAGLFFSKRLRRFILLVLISCAMNQGRSAMLIVGSGLVACLGSQNTYRNLYRVAQSIVCNLKKKKELLDVSPIDNYVRMIKWVRDQLKMFSDWGVAKFEANLNVWHTLESEEVRRKLEQAEAELKNKVDEVEAVFNAVMSIGKKVAPVLTTILLIALTARFLKKYTGQKRYKNVFITSRFVEYDQRQKALGKPHVLPLTKEEARHYIFIPSAKLRLSECLPMAMFFIPVGFYILSWFFLLGLDGLLYWITVIISDKLKELNPFYIPLIMQVNSKHQVLSIPVAEVNRQRDFSFSVSLVARECYPEPTLLLSQAVVPLCSVITVLLILGLLAAKLLQVKLLASEYFFTENTDKRVKYLHNKILNKRSQDNFMQVEQARFQSLKKDVVQKNTFTLFPAGETEEAKLEAGTVHEFRALRTALQLAGFARRFSTPDLRARCLFKRFPPRQTFHKAGFLRNAG
ncbi:dendritic cell-specific transmembrane protein-like [Colossoma macropomum]|uniref:dendritic cell-specific transmembrane protein-like n=1 Tax=Colossoma macropomum TaxID=42526 RepID=UPI001864F111|nr:dendritic cell-specific transmembrane protein-like [Colossoma macropomum]